MLIIQHWQKELSHYYNLIYKSRAVKFLFLSTVEQCHAKTCQRVIKTPNPPNVRGGHFNVVRLNPRRKGPVIIYGRGAGSNDFLRESISWPTHGEEVYFCGPLDYHSWYKIFMCETTAKKSSDRQNFDMPKLSNRLTFDKAKSSF